MKLAFISFFLCLLLSFQVSAAGESCKTGENAVHDLIGEGGSGVDLTKAKGPANNRADIKFEPRSADELLKLGDKYAYVPRSSLAKNASIDPRAVDPNTGFIRVRVEGTEVGTRPVRGSATRRDISGQDIDWRAVQVDVDGNSIPQSKIDFDPNNFLNPKELPYIPTAVSKGPANIVNLPDEARSIVGQNISNFNEGDILVHIDLYGSRQQLVASGQGSSFKAPDGKNYRWQNGKLQRESHKTDDWGIKKWVDENGAVGLIEAKPPAAAATGPGPAPLAQRQPPGPGAPPPPSAPIVQRVNIIGSDANNNPVAIAAQIQRIPNTNTHTMNVNYGNRQMEFTGIIVPGDSPGTTQFLAQTQGGKPLEKPLKMPLREATP